MRSANRAYLYPVDHLRAAAALLVVVYHSTQLISARVAHDRLFRSEDWLYSRNPVKTVVFEGHTGVALFMVLSGFIFMTGAVDREVSYGRFMVNRLLRIYPLYLVLLFVAISTRRGSFQFGPFLQAVLPLGNYGSTIGGAWGAMFWAVGIEMQFYLLFPLLLRLLTRGGPATLVRIIAAMLALRTLAYLADPAGVDLNWLTYYTIVGRLDQFLLGMLAGWVFVKHRHRLGPGVLAGSVLLAVAMLWVFNQVHGYADPKWWRVGWVDLEGAVWAAVIASYVAVLERRAGLLSRGVAKLGETSYSIYLLHFVIVSRIATSRLVLHVGGAVSTAVLTAVVVVVPGTVALAFLTYHAIERPFLALRIRYLRDQAPAGPPEQAGSLAPPPPASPPASTASPTPPPASPPAGTAGTTPPPASSAAGTASPTPPPASPLAGTASPTPPAALSRPVDGRPPMPTPRDSVLQ